jgi:hypothetical protein
MFNFPATKFSIMNFRPLFFLSILVLAISPVFAQNPGDTIVVNVLNYSSGTRDTTAIFPNNSAISFEKVIMRYAMRCKGALVSTGAQRNRGCGEWDYSCNTYLTDPTKADSTSASMQRYAIYPDTNTSKLFSRTATWRGTPQIQQSVQLQSIISEDTAFIGQGTMIDSNIIYTQGLGGKTYFIITGSELQASNLLQGNISGLSFTHSGNNLQLLQLRVKIKASTLNSLEFPDSVDFRGMQEVYYHNYPVNNGLNRINFHTPFNWDGSSNLLVELSYKGINGNAALKLGVHASTGVQTISSANDVAFNFFSSNYGEADNYQGVTGSNQRTVEAWIKTTDAGKDIISWGNNSLGNKFIVRLESTGQLRVEVNGGNYVGTKVLNDGQWHHIAVTFNGSSMYHFRFVVDGVWDRPTAINNTGVTTAAGRNVQISGGFHNRNWSGSIDDVRIWSIKLADTTIANWRYRKIDASHANYNNLEMLYALNGQSNVLEDESPNGRDGHFTNHSQFTLLTGEEQFKDFSVYNVRPSIHLYQGSYNLSVSNDTLIDTTYFKPYSVITRSAFSKAGSIYSDSLASTESLLWPAFNELYDINGNLLSRDLVMDTTRLKDSTISYFNRSPIKVELMSFVTPYGIGLDLGSEGKAWYFDVSDFIPLLKGPRRINLERGGQFQEEMDIQFLFIVGTPPREVKRMEQIWPVSARSYTQIINNDYFAPITLPLDTSARSYKIRSVITGHGQQGEFIPRNHFLNVNGGPVEFNWTVWKECAENPVYPQGGTWIFDRAGWCPGMASDMEEYDITSMVQGDTAVTLDYGVSTASGDSRYIVNNQLVSYGAPNFNLDARITEVVSPNDFVEFERINPVCNGAEIILQNSGATSITSAVIEYWVNSGARETYNWSGSLNFLQTENVALPTPATFWSTLNTSNNVFYARLVSVNGQSDQYSHNNNIQRNFSIPNVLHPNFSIEFSTNSAASESRYDLRDDMGNVLFQRNGMSNNQTYRDTFNLSTGCYSFNVYDSDDDGISFFANNDGNGSVRIIDNVGGAQSVRTFNPDYGDGFRFNFTVGSLVGIEEQRLGENITIFPNPAKESLTVELADFPFSAWSVHDGLGRVIEERELKRQANNYRFQLDLSTYQSGIYFIRFEQAERTIVKRFVVGK